MIIAGLQKLSLLDFPGKVAATVFTGGCNLRCPFCHNSELLEAPPALMTAGEFFEFLSGRKGKIDGVCITGGEPCLQPDLCDFMKQIKTAGFAVKLDTNGTHPERLVRMIREGLVQYVAMDIKNSPARYAETCGVDSMDLSPVYASIELLLTSPTDYEFRTTVMEELHDDASFAAIGPMIAGAKRYFLQPFRDRDTVLFAGFHAPGEETLRRWAELVKPYVSAVSIRGNE